MNMIFKYLLAWLVLLVGQGCQPTETVLVPLPPQKTDTIAQPITLTDRLDQEWFVVAINDQGKQKKPISKIQITVRFSMDRLSGSTGCNRYFGSYQLKNDHGLIIKGVGATEMACPEPIGIMQQEQTFLQLLSLVKIYYIENEQLTFYAEDGQAILTFDQKRSE